MTVADFLSPDQNDYTNRDRLLPSQPLMRQFFRDFTLGGDRGFIASLHDCINSVLPIKSVHEKFDIQLKPGMTYETLGSDLSTLHFLQLLVRLTDAKHVLEIGTYIGVSTMFLAEAVGEYGTVTTIESGKEFAEIAAGNFERNGFMERGAHPRIRLIVRDVVKEFSYGVPGNYYQLIFLDGAKEHYVQILPQLLTCLRPGGLLVVDDVFCQGDTLNETPTTDKGRGVKAMLEFVSLTTDLSPVILPYGDGLLLLRKPT